MTDYIPKKCSMTTLKFNPETGDYYRCKNNTRQGMLTCRTHSEFEEVIGDADMTFIEQMPEECPVCIEEFCQKDEPLSCGHWIHRSCVIRSGKAECPVCRSSLELTHDEMVETLINADMVIPDQIEDIPPEIDFPVDVPIHDLLGVVLVMIEMSDQLNHTITT